MNERFTLTLLLAVYLLLLSSCAEQVVADKIPPHQIFKIQSKVLSETRVISVWTPPNYENSGLVYPVLYMPDGGLKEDFPHIANTLSELVRAGKIKPLILIGIENTERHRDLTGATRVEYEATLAPATDGSTPFRSFIKDELFSQVTRRYRVNEHRAIVGESLAGLFTVETFFLDPSMFEIYIAMDPSIYWNKSILVTSAAKQLTKLPKDINFKLWFAGSDAEDIYINTDQLAKELTSNAPKNLKWNYLPQPKEHHNTIFRATKERAFIWGLWSD